MTVSKLAGVQNLKGPTSNEALQHQELHLNNVARVVEAHEKKNSVLSLHPRRLKHYNTRELALEARNK